MVVHTVSERILLKILDILTLICDIFYMHIYIYIYTFTSRRCFTKYGCYYTHMLTNTSQLQANEGNKEVMNSTLL